MNSKTPKGRSAIKRHKWVFRKLLKSYKRLALVNKELGGEHAFELPKDCRLWQDNAVKRMVRELDMVGIFSTDVTWVLPQSTAARPGCR